MGQKHTTELFTRAQMGTWEGVIPHYGTVNFSVIGTYGDNCDPRIIINTAEIKHDTNHVAINWRTGEVIKYFPRLG